jgi:TM2 domain-containing membrane protein YozV
MDQQQMMMMLRDLQPDELMIIQDLTREMTDNQQKQFFLLYQGKRKEQQTLLIMALIGFFGVAGIHRFMIGDAVLGVVYLLTIGFCGIGTIIDAINIKNLTSDYNRKQAIEAGQMVKMMGT